MPKFQYKARKSDGKSVSGVVDAATMDAAASRLIGQGMTPISVTPASSAESSAAGGAEEAPVTKGKVKTPELIMFTRQMYSLMKAGVPINRSLMGLSQAQTNKYLKYVVTEMAGFVGSGRTFSEALAQFPKVFPSLYVSIIQVGENAGKMDVALQQLSGYLALEKATKDAISSAMRYPIIVMITISIAVSVVNFKVVPAFAKMFKSFNAELPMVTIIMMESSDFMLKYWPYILVVIFGSIGGFIYYKKTPKGKAWWDKWRLRIPLIGNVVFRAILARFCRSFAMAMQSGVPLLEGIAFSIKALDNDWMAERISEVSNSIEHGEGLTAACAKTQLFTPLVMQMIAVGEETGQIDDQLMEVAIYYEEEVAYDLDRLGAMIEPILILIIGVMVMFLALGIFLPMWDIINVIK